MKKIISLALMLVVASALVIATSAAVPTPWFDLAFEGDGVIDAQGNATPEIYGGYVQDTTVVVDGTEYAINCYYGGTGEMPGECIEVALPFDAEGVEFSEFILGGSTIEVVFQIDNPLAGDQSGNAGLFTSCYGGGYSLYHADGLYSFYMSSATNNSYVVANSIDVPLFGELVMLQGVFVPEENALYLYQNGEMYGAAAWTEGDTYRWGNAFSDTLGLGINCSYTSESVGDFSSYKIVDARLYNVALTEEQAAERWAEVLAQVTSGAAAPATQAPATETEAPATETEAPATETEAPATETEAPATETEAPATETEAPATETEAPATETEAPATETEAPATETEAPATETEAPATQAPSEVVDQAAQTFDFGVVAAIAAVVSLAGYAVAKKH